MASISATVRALGSKNEALSRYDDQVLQNRGWRLIVYICTPRAYIATLTCTHTHTRTCMHI